MISASKTTFSLNNIKILRPKVTKNLTNLLKRFCEPPPGSFSEFPNSLYKYNLRHKVHYLLLFTPKFTLKLMTDLVGEKCHQCFSTFRTQDVFY